MPNLGEVSLKIKINSEDITKQVISAFGKGQKEADSHVITYKIAGDKSSLETALKQLQGMTPEILTKIKLDFNKDDYDKEMNLLKKFSEKNAKEIGEYFKASIENSLKGFSIKDIIGKDLKKNTQLTENDIAKLKTSLQELINQTGNFDLSKATSVGEINNQVVALNKMKSILETISKHSGKESVIMDSGKFNIAAGLQSATSQIDSIMSNVGNVIKTNASQWATTLETTFNNEFKNIITLFNSLQDIINGVFNGSGTGSGSGIGQITGDMKDLQVEIDKTTKEIEELENKLAELQSKQGSSKKTSSDDIEIARNKIIKAYSAANEEFVWEGKGKQLNNFKNLVNEFMNLGGQIKDLTPGAKKLVENLKITQIVPLDVNKEIETLTRLLDEAKKKKEELLGQKQALSSGAATGVQGTGTGQGTGSGTGGQGIPTNATVSPTLSSTFKEDLQKLVDATGSVNATVSGKLSETFLSDLQTNADGIGTVKVGVDFGKKEGSQSQEIPVDVITTPKLSETFKDDLQKVIDETGKYTITIGTSENQQTDLVPIKASVENGKEFRDQLKQTVEGSDGLDVKVKPVIDTDFQLEINNAVLKDVKVEGTIQGGNLKPDSVETPITAPSLTTDVPATSIEAAKEGLEEVKQGHEEASKAAEKSGEIQKRSLLEVAKELSKAKAELDDWISRANSSRSSNEMSQFVAQKKQQAQEYSNIQELIAKIQSKMSESSSNSATNTDKIKHLAGIVAYVERLQKLMGNAFSYNVLGENGEEQFKLMKQAVDQASGSVDVAAKKVRELNLQVRSLQDEQSALEKTATNAEKLEAKLYDAAKAIEALQNKKGKKYDSFVGMYDQYKRAGGTSDISAFTNEQKVIDAVTKSYNNLVTARKSTAAETKLIYELAHPNVDINQFDSIFKQIETGALTAKQATEKLDVAIKALKSETEKTTAQPVITQELKDQKPVKVDAKGEINVIPKVEDPVGFANQVTEQLKGQSATIDIKPHTTTNTTTDVGTTGMSYETEQAEALRKKVVEVTTAVDNKTNAFRQEEQVVIGTVQSEISNLEVLDGQLTIILQDIQKIIENPLKVNIDYSSIDQLSQVDENSKSSIDKLKASIDGLQTGVLSDLGKAFSGLQLPNDVASKIESLAKALELLKTSLSDIDNGSIGFLDSVKDLAVKAEGLKDLATVIRASKEEIQKAQETIAKQNNHVDVQGVSAKNVVIGTEEWNTAIKRAEQYKDVIGEVHKITYNFRRDSDGKYYKSFSFFGEKGKAVEGKDGALLYGNEIKKLDEVVSKTSLQMDNLITKFEDAAKKAKLVYDTGSLKIDDNGIITFATTVENLGNQSVTTKYKIEDLNEALNKDGSLSKTYLNNHAEEKSTRIRTLADQMAVGREKAALKSQKQEEDAVLAQSKAINKAIEQRYKEEQTLIDQMASVREKANEKAHKQEEATQLAQNKAINKAIEQGYQERESLIEQMSSGREKSNLKELKLERQQELNQAKAINKALEDEYKRSQKAKLDAEKEAQAQRDQFNKLNMNGIDLLIKKREEEAKSFSNSLKAQMESEQVLIDQMASGREKANVKSQKIDLQNEIAQSKAINKSLEDEYKERQKNIKATEKQTELDKKRALTFTESASKRLSSAVSKYSYGDTSYANTMIKQLNSGLSNFGDLSNIKGNIKQLSFTVDKIIVDLKHSHEQSLKALNKEIQAENKLQSQKDSFNQKNINAIDYEIKKREEEAKLFSSTLKADMQERYSGFDKEKVDESLTRTKSLMDQVFAKKQNISGFQAAFDRAQEEVDELNDKLKQGKISNLQTGYTDKINKIIADLNSVIAVTNPFDKVSAQTAMRDFLSSLNNGKVTIKDFTNNGKTLTATFEEQKGVLREVSAVWDETSGKISLVDKGTKRAQSTLTAFMDGLKARFRSLIQYLATFVSFYRIFGMIKNGIQVVRDLDTALTEMRKVSDETVSSLKNFQDVSFDIAKSVGTTAKQIQNSTADFMRLGESLEDAAKSAEVANILLNVSEFESIDEATESLVSMSAAFDELEKIDIVDKLNLIGNNFAISTDGLATALQNSASALKTANNDIDESIALATAANAVVQDPDKVGAGLRTIALRITGTEAAKEELQELGEDVDDFVVTTTSKLNQQVMDLTKTVGKDGISLLDDNGNYRSTYEILQDIADVWEKIAEEDLKTGQNRQNALLEMLAGKNRSNILASILQSPETLREAYESSLNDSAGSAQQELEKYLDSIEGKIQLFTNEVQEFWHNLISSDVIKGFVDAGTTIVDILGKIVDKLGILGTAAASFGAAFAFKHVNKNSGGRAKTFALKSNQICHRIV